MIKKTIFSQTLATIEEKIKTNVWKHGEKLPAISLLSQELDVGVGTVWKAICALQKNGLLSIQRKHGIFVGKETVARNKTLKPEPSTTKANLLKLRITDDIIKGKSGYVDFLPNCKELCHEYGTGYLTLKKTLQLLVTDKRIEPYKRGYKIVRSKPHSYSNTIVLIIQGEGFFSQITDSHFNTRFTIFLNHLEKLCSERNLRLIRQVYDTRFSSLNGFNESLGFIIWSYNAVPDIAQLLTQFKKPIIIFDDQYQIKTAPANQHIHLFRTADHLAGYQIGKYLLDTGHRKIFYFTNYEEKKSKNEWAIQRFLGLKKAFNDAGLSDENVQTFHTPITDLKIGQQKSSSEKLWMESQQNGEQSLTQLDVHVQKKVAKEYGQHLISRTIQNSLGHIEVQNYVTKGIWNIFKIPDISAIVCHDDYIAAYGVNDYCKRNKISIPEKLSLIGFNNQIESFYYNLTTYDFNMPAMVGKMVDTIMRPGKQKPGQRNPVVETEGFIVIRESTRALN